MYGSCSKCNSSKLLHSSPRRIRPLAQHRRFIRFSCPFRICKLRRLFHRHQFLLGLHHRHQLYNLLMLPIACLLYWQPYLPSQAARPLPAINRVIILEIRVFEKAFVASLPVECLSYFVESHQRVVQHFKLSSFRLLLGSVDLQTRLWQGVVLFVERGYLTMPKLYKPLCALDGNISIHCRG